MTSIGTWLHTRLKGELVGTDANGNRYYQSRKDDSRPLYHRKRWVIYKIEADPVLIDPAWSAWLHYIIDRPLETASERIPPTWTGTSSAWYPPGDERRGGQRPSATGDYHPWRP